MVEHIEHEGILLALILRATPPIEGIQFFTSAEATLQLGSMRRPAGYIIAPHVHNPVRREVQYTQEVLFLRSGRLRLDFYDETQRYLRSVLAETGDVMLLARGGHGLEMLEPCEIVEVKQGPYIGDHDKTRFSPVSSDRVLLEGVAP